MSDPIAFYSSEFIAREELSNLIVALGGKTMPEGAEVGVLSRGSNHLWIFLSNKEINYLEAEERRIVTQRLGNTPLSCVVVEISREPGSNRLAIDFALAFMQKWKSILSGQDETLYTQQDIARGGSFDNGFYGS